MTTRTTPEPDDTLLSVEHVHLGFASSRGIVRAVDDVSLEVRVGESVGLVGESGSGKSMLARTIMGIAPAAAEVRSGRVWFDGSDLNVLSAAERARYMGAQIAMIFQDPMTSLNPVVRVGRQVTESMRFHRRMSRAQADARAVELLEKVGLPDARDRLRRYPHELSGGMRQRVSIAAALACEPRLVIADEPTTALDVTVQRQILDLLERLQTEQGMGLLLITHDLGVVASRTDRLIVMYAGQVVETGTTMDLFEHPTHPYTQALLDSIPSVGAPSHTRLTTIPGSSTSAVGAIVGCRFAPRCALAQDRCRSEDPPLVGLDHRHRCFFPLEGRASAPGRTSIPGPSMPVEIGRRRGVDGEVAHARR